jgi:F420-dependent oxidoreductase-like protein
MRINLMIEGQESVTWEQWLALGRTCEQAGFEGLFRSDHYSSVFGVLERSSLDAWTTLAGLAATTSRIRLGTLVSPVTFRHPSILARALVTVDHISGGRAELGIGAGWYELEHRAHGFAFPDLKVRLELFAEQLEIIHRQLTEDAFTFTGNHYELEDCRALPKPVQRPRPPIIVGGSAGSGTLLPAVRFADEYNTGYVTLDVCRERCTKVRTACAQAGREPALAFSFMTAGIVAEDRSALLERVRRAAIVMDDSRDPEEILREPPIPWIAGTVDEVVELLHAYAQAGVERMMLQHLVHDDLEMVELLGAEVLPRVVDAA